MSTRPCERSDLTAVAELALATFPGLAGTRPDALASEFEEVFFDSPWADDALPSLVAESGGTLTGFMGCVPRPMRFKDRTIATAVATSLMVRQADSGRRDPFTGVQLLRRFLAGRQALSLTDTANEATRRLWTGSGGTIAHPYSFWWLRPLRPAATCAHFVARTAPPWVGPIIRPLGALADRLHSLWPVGFPPPAPPPATVIEDLDTATHLDALRSQPPRALMPCYDPASLDWLVAKTARSTPDATLVRRLVRTEGGTMVGWFIYLRPRQGVGCLLQYAAHPRSSEVVLDALLHQAHRDGLVALWGRADPMHAGFLTRRRCVFFGTPTVLVHSPDPEILQTVLAGDLWFSGFEGELWMRGNAAR